MFNQVMIHPDDQVSYRFPWRSSSTEQPRVYQWVRLNFGDKPAPDIAVGAVITLAKISIQKQLKNSTHTSMSMTLVDPEMMPRNHKSNWCYTGDRSIPSQSMAL